MHATSQTPKVLLLGYRKNICNVLERRQISYALWDPKPRKPSQYMIHCLQKDMPAQANAIRETAQTLLPFGPFTHVIAGTEHAVYPASITRRIVGARKSKDSIALSCHDKLIMKNILKANHVPMTPYLHTNSTFHPDEIIETLGFPVVIKPRNGSGGRQTYLCQNSEELKQHLHRNQLVEKFIDAPEASVESFIQNKKILFTNITQYHVKTHVNIVPAQFDPDTQKTILAFNEKVIRDLRLSWGITHMEIYLTKQGPLFGEIALRPPGGYIMHLMSLSYGFNAWEAFVAIELGQSFTFPTKPIAASAALILHPGEGYVQKITGWEQTTAHSSIKEKQLIIAVGDYIQKRSSVSNNVGYIILSAKNKHELMQQIHNIQRNLKIILSQSNKNSQHRDIR